MRARSNSITVLMATNTPFSNSSNSNSSSLTRSTWMKCTKENDVLKNNTSENFIVI